MTTLTVVPLTMPGVHFNDENPLPRFRDDPAHRHVAVHESLPALKHHLLGHECGTRVLPYRMQDNYTRQRVPITYDSVVLENDILKATFMPILGGRLLSLFHKPSNRELLNRNPVFQPANLAIRNAWFSGGIEWNVSQFGHTFATCSPVYAATITGSDGEPGLRLYEFERCKKLCWQIDFYLPPGSPWLIAHTRVANPNDTETSMYWWSNTAVDERPDVRVLAPSRNVIYTDLREKEHQFGFGPMPHLTTFNHQDASYSTHAGAASEYFFQPDNVEMPWETALGADGSGFIEASTARLQYRKMFCWGTHSGGQHWQEFLSPGGKPYLEIQAGLAPTQLHGLMMPAQTDWHWTQIFGLFRGDASLVHHADWDTAWQYVDTTLKAHISVAQLAHIDAQYAQRADLPPTRILQHGSSWGALETMRRAAQHEAPLSPAFVFPSERMGAEQHKWLTLLTDGTLPAPAPTDVPGEWMVQREWFDLLAHSPHTAHNWYALLHLGVMRREHFDHAGAIAAWQASLALQPNAWAWRNLARMALERHDHTHALTCYANAWAVQPHILEVAQEYIELLCRTNQYAHALAIYDTLPNDIQHNGRVLIMRCRIAIALGDLDTAERLLQREYAVIREGETELSDLWFALWYQRTAPNTPLTDAQKATVRQQHPPPAHLDFRMIIN
ncbi:MAG: hypothetical protein RL076_2816 [Chloroflexota bacterium]|jgi:hypothetical protein